MQKQKQNKIVQHFVAYMLYYWDILTRNDLIYIM